MMSLGRMGVFAILTSCLCVFESSCLTMKPLRYAVDIINDGKEKIVVDPFEVTKGQHATVAVGEVSPGGTAGMSPFYRRPMQTLTITWRVLSTGERGQAQVTPELPKEFTKDRGSSIILRIRPEEQRVDVTYEILDPRTGQVSILRQGEPSQK